MTTPSRKLSTGILLALSLGLLACQEKTVEKQAPEQATAINPGMRAYVDPVTGSYAPAPTQAPTEPPAPAANAMAVTPTPKPPQEVPLPKGGVMIELGDQLQAKDRAAK